MSESIRNTQLDGDVSIGRNVALGGDALVQGYSTIKKDLTVEGWLHAKNINSCDKGLFSTLADLQEAYPNPHDGWWAIIGDTVPGEIYEAKDGEWVATGEIGGAQRGEQGLSAYDIWLSLGNTGTEQDFIDSLKGAKGDPGDGADITIDAELDVNSTNAIQNRAVAVAFENTIKEETIDTLFE